MAYVVTPPATVGVPVNGTGDLFPVRRIFCVGRNYAAHAREMGHDPDRELPFFFTKPADAVIDAAGAIPYPPATNELHHEIEMVVALAKGGRDIAPGDALSLVWGYGVGLDLTLRDVQAAAKKLARPWDFAKGFDASGPCSALRPVGSGGHPAPGTAIWLEVNGERRQSGTLAQMICSLPEIIAAISRSVELKAGDLIFTGTPAGVGPLQPADKLHGVLEGVAEFSCEIAHQPV